MKSRDAAGASWLLLLAALALAAAIASQLDWKQPADLMPNALPATATPLSSPAPNQLEPTASTPPALSHRGNHGRT